MQMMKQQRKSKVLTLENIDFLLLAALLISFFLHYRINGFMVMLVLIFAVVKVLAKRNLFKGSAGLLFFPALFLTLLLGQLYTENVKEGWTLIERNISLLALPFAVKGVVDLTHFQRRVLMNLFIASAAFTGLVCLSIATVNSVQTGSIYVIPNNTHFLYNTFMHHRLTDPIGLHAVYFGLSVALANGVVLYNIISPGKKVQKRIGLGLLFVFFTVLLYLLKSANIAFGFSIVSLVIILDRYGRSIFSSRAKLSVGMLILLAFSFFTFKTIQTKLENFSFSHEMADEQMTPLGIRLSIWECTWQVIQENWLLGTGTGDSQDELVKKYYANNFVIGYRDDFNAHNMYLQYWMSNGLPMLLLFVGALVMLFQRAIKNRNSIFFGFVLLFTLFSFTESTMRTQKGLLFFVLFAALFYWCPKWMITKTDEA